ncbi:hypothetical protein HG531_001039 [Fusarium graminearum]|nr:hypothetical protein HG531_001039 [Fusarium graminearum]
MARLIFVYAALFFWVTLAVAQYDHNNLLKGCYQGRSDDFTLGGFARTQPQRERCALVCSQRGNTFVAFGTVHCFCAKSEPPSTNEVDITRCKAHGLDGWNAPKLGKANHIEEVFVVFNIDPKRKSDNSKSSSQDEAKLSPHSGSPAGLAPSAGPSKPLGCYPGLPIDVHLTKITITEDERRECAKSCGGEGKAAVVFSGFKCGCTNILPDASTRVEDIRYKSKVAAVRQNSCICAESYPERSRRRPDSLCKSSCPGNPYEDCGGTQVWTVVNTGLDTRVSFDKPRLKEQPEDFNMNPGSKKASLSGCYAEESVTQGAIQVHIGGGRVELCASRCRNLKMPVSALQGNTCVCRDTIPRKDSKVDKFHCNHSCRDADEGSCGGKDTYSIYNSGLQGHIRIDANTKQSHGCFRFDRFLSTRRTPELVRVDIHGPNRNPKGGSCTTQCAEKGFAVALRHHTQCFCSPGLPPERRRVDDEFCSIGCRGDTLETCGGPSYAYTVYKTDAYMPDLHTEKKPKAKKPKQEDLSPSPDSRPQCLHPALDKVYEVFNEVSDRMAVITQKVRHGFFWLRDKSQHIFDVCLWHVMLFFSNIMYRLGLLSAEGVVEL